MEMLKKLAKRIDKELRQAEDYCEQAYLVKHKSSETADLFTTLANEEIDHAKRLLKEGQRLITAKNVMSYDKARETTETDHEKHCHVIWEWEHRMAMETISELEYKLSRYRSMS